MKNQPIPQTTISTIGYIRRYYLVGLPGTSLSTPDRWVRSGRIPKPIKLGEKSTVSDAVEINRWLEGRRNTSA